MVHSSLLDFKVTVPLFVADHLYLGTPTRRHQEQWSPPESLGDGLEIRFSTTAAARLVNRIRKQEFAKLEWAKLAWMVHALQGPSYDLLAPVYLKDRWERVGVIPYPHQLETARKVIEEFGGRAILADEVGLGKTIEACLILREYMLRGQVERALILAPAALIWQWYHELREKFVITPVIQRTEYDWERSDIILASIDTAKRSPHREIIHSLEYDLLIVDEAHRLKNERTENYRFVQGIQKTFCLMLTATPVQNDLRELYNLVDLTVPGLLGTRYTFRRQFMIDKRRPAQPDLLRERLSRVLIRNRRGPDTVQMTARKVHTIRCRLTEKERALYDALFSLGASLRSDDQAALPSLLSVITLQREACSSSHACLSTLYKLAEKTQEPGLQSALRQVIEQAETVREHAKVQRALELVQSVGEQVIIFTEYRATQQLLLQKLEQNGIMAMGFDGTLSSSRKEWIKELFRRYAQVLVSTESGGEGLNFQFCAHLINYDLPWNPMKLEQRIGRIHRLGQTRDVQIYNLVTEGTIEEYILHVLYEKIRLFEMAVGELDDILSRAHLPVVDLERELTSLLSTAQSPGEVRELLGQFAAKIDAALAKGRASVDSISIDSLLDS